MSEVFEWTLFKSYMTRSFDEQAIDNLCGVDHSPAIFLFTEGFEERSIGVAETLARSGATFSRVVVGKHTTDISANSKYHDRAIKAAEQLAPGRWVEAPIDLAGDWIKVATASSQVDTIVLDITGLSSRTLFGALDTTAAQSSKVVIAYSEAAQYWPKELDWQNIRLNLSGFETVADLVDDAPWLFGHEHSVELLPGHEGYDSPAASSLLIGFLPFKRARLAAVVTNHDYERFIFVAGLPRLDQNSWRHSALIEINKNIIGSWPLVDMSTFGYRQTLSDLFQLTFANSRDLLLTHNLHLTLLGSKLQDVGCWVFSKLVPSIAVLTSVPHQYFPEAFSEGTGAQWHFVLAKPHAH